MVLIAFVHALLRGFLRALSRVTPAGAARIAMWLTLRTQRSGRKPIAADRSRRLTLPDSASSDVVLHELVPAVIAETAPRVLLVHGWNGASADWRHVAIALLARGCRVIVADMPAHGAARGRFSSLPRFVRALAVIERELGPFDVWVGHSLGAAAIVAAVARGAHARRLVLVNGMVRAEKVLAGMARQAGLSPIAIRAFLAGIERQEAMTFADMDTVHNAARVNADALIVHDESDRIAPFADAQHLADSWTRALFMRTIGLGHRRILQDDRVIEAIATFALH